MSQNNQTEITIGDPHSSHASNIPFSESTNITGEFIDTSENRPLLRGHHEKTILAPEYPQDESFSDVSSRLNGAQTVTCRVCEHQIPYENKSMQHVVRCPSCREATPIRAPPVGKKFVRCPCNCLLICRVSSNRVACPRSNCARVIILKPATSGEPSSVSAPPGTARVECVFCQEIFMFNTLSSAIARCPHCVRLSSVGLGYVRSRMFGYFVAALIALLTELFIMIGTIPTFGHHPWLVVVYVGLFALMLIFCQRFYYYFTMKISKILGPL